MSRNNSRRKTLSHAEIENFLMDLTPEKEIIESEKVDITIQTTMTKTEDDISTLKASIRQLYKAYHVFVFFNVLMDIFRICPRHELRQVRKECAI